MDPVGILNACTTNVVPKIARITVTTSDSKVSRRPDFLYGSTMRCGLLSDQLEQVPGRLLLRRLLARSAAQSLPIFACHRLHSKGLLMLGPLFVHHAIRGDAEVLRLQVFLQ